MTEPSEGARRDAEVAKDICNRCWHEITPDHPISIREITDVLSQWHSEIIDRETHSAEMQQALEKIAEIGDFRPIVRWMREVGGKFDKPFNTVDGLLEFTLYSDLCSAGEIARDALNIELPACECGTQNDCEKHDWHPNLPPERWAMRRQLSEAALKGGAL